MNVDGSYTDPTQHLFWLGSRALGIVAVLLVSVAVGLGLALSGRMVRLRGAPAWLKTAHEAVTLTAIGAITGHGLLLLGDSYLDPGIVGITIPFALKTQPAWTGLGVIGGWLTVVLGLSYYARRWIGVRTWRKVHRWTLLAYALALVHTVGAGTDATSAWLLFLLCVFMVPVVAIGCRRIALRSPAGATKTPAVAHRA